MPATVEEWDAGVAYTPLAKAVLSFLRSEPRTGYSLDELDDLSFDIGRMYGTKHIGTITPEMLEKALAELIELADTSQVVAKKLVHKNGSTIYYRYGR